MRSPILFGEYPTNILALADAFRPPEKIQEFRGGAAQPPKLRMKRKLKGPWGAGRWSPKVGQPDRANKPKAGG